MCSLPLSKSKLYVVPGSLRVKARQGKQAQATTKIEKVLIFDLRSAKASQRISIESVSLPRHSVPRALVADHLDRHDHAIAAQFVGAGDAVIKASIGIHCEF